jgi:hypothetical protein
MLPCGGCDHCVRVSKQWGSFILEVDEAVPLTSQFMQSVTGVTGGWDLLSRQETGNCDNRPTSEVGSTHGQQSLQSADGVEVCCTGLVEVVVIMQRQ